MPSGGARLANIGSGRGRPKGSKNAYRLGDLEARVHREMTAGQRRVLREIADTDRDPIWVAIAAANDETLPISVRLMATAIAEPYIRPKLSATMISHAPAAPTEAARNAVADLLDRLRPPPVQIEHDPCGPASSTHGAQPDKDDAA
jgi:hypothetical protein